LKHNLASLKALLRKAPAVNVRTKLTRLVAKLDLGPSPNWLFTSGKPNRYNPAGVDCVYFGETWEVAQSEYDPKHFRKHLLSAQESEASTLRPNDSLAPARSARAGLCCWQIPFATSQAA